MSGQLQVPALLAHVFLTDQDRNAQLGWNRLRSLWGDVVSRFGLDRPVQRLAVPLNLPPQRPVAVDGFGLLAAAEREEASVWQASAWSDHHMLCLTAMMAPPRDTNCAGAWATLEHAWDQIMAGHAHDGVLGEARIFQALLEDPHGNGTDPPLDSLRATMLGPAGTGWWQYWDAVPLGSQAEILIWEAGPQAQDDRVARRLAAVAPAESESLVDRFLWTSGDGSPAPLTRHLMHAARLRHQIRVFAGGIASRDLRDELGSLFNALDAGPGPARNDDLSARLRNAHGAAIALRARMQEMRREVGIAGENIRLALNLAAADAAVGPLTEDRYLATWFGQQVDGEIARLDAAAGNAQSAETFLAARAQARAPTSTLAAMVGHPRRASQVPGVGKGRKSRRTKSAREPWAIVLTALPTEYTAVAEHLGSQVETLEEGGTLYEVGDLPDARGAWHVAIAQTGQGAAMAGMQLVQAIPVFRPQVALFLGIAGGRKDVARGDVVAAEAVYDYESGRSTLEGHEPRMRPQVPTWRMLQRARLVARQNRWQRRILPGCPEPPPAAFVKPIVTGAKVIAHDQSEAALMVGKYASDAVAVEMEGIGFLEAAYLHPGLDALVIRGISDLLIKTQADEEYWQPIASRHAAAFAVELLDSIGAGRA